VLVAGCHRLIRRVDGRRRTIPITIGESGSTTDPGVDLPSWQRNG
jgi:hypothetical protein